MWLQGLADKTSLAGLCERLSCAEEDSRECIEGKTVRSGRSDAGNVVAAWSRVNLRLMHKKRSDDFPIPRFVLGECPIDEIVHTISGARKTLSGGSLLLAPRTHLVLDSTCVGVHLKDVVVQGVHLFRALVQMLGTHALNIDAGERLRLVP